MTTTDSPVAAEPNDDEEPARADVVTLGGRRFREITRPSFNQDIWVMRHARVAGITSVLDGASSTTSDDPEALVARVLERALEGDHMVNLLAGVLVEDGAPWSRDRAEANAQFFGGLTDPAEKEILQTRWLIWLANFFAGGAASLVRSLSSSPQTSENADARRTRPPGEPATRSSASGAS
jgi:hypothetical protein